RRRGLEDRSRRSAGLAGAVSAGRGEVSQRDSSCWSEVLPQYQTTTTPLLWSALWLMLMSCPFSSMLAHCAASANKLSQLVNCPARNIWNVICLFSFISLAPHPPI